MPNRTACEASGRQSPNDASPGFVLDGEGVGWRRKQPFAVSRSFPGTQGVPSLACGRPGAAVTARGAAVPSVLPVRLGGSWPPGRAEDQFVGSCPWRKHTKSSGTDNCISAHLRCAAPGSHDEYYFALTFRKQQSRCSGKAARTKSSKPRARRSQVRVGWRLRSPSSTVCDLRGLLALGSSGCGRSARPATQATFAPGRALLYSSASRVHCGSVFTGADQWVSTGAFLRITGRIREK